MTPQIGTTGSPQATGADPHHITGPGKPAKKGLFSKLMALLNPSARNNKPSTEEVPGIHAATDSRKFVFYAKKSIPNPRSSTPVDKERPSKKQDEQKHHAQAPTSGAHIMEAGIYIQPEKQAHINRATGGEQVFTAALARPHRTTGDQLPVNIARSARQALPSSGSGREDGESYPPINGRIDPAAIDTASGPLVKPDIHSRGHSSRKNMSALAEKHLETKPPLEFPSGKPSKKPAIAQQADSRHHENTGKAALASRAQPESSTERLTQASYSVFAGNISSGPKRSGQHPGQAHEAVETDLDVDIRASTKHRNPRLELTPMQKSHLHHAVEQQENSHVRQTAAPTLLTAAGTAEASDDLPDGNATISARSSHSASGLYALQTPHSDTASVALTQHGKAILPQTQPGSGPWTIAAAMQEVGRAAFRGQHRLELRLEPAHLGKIQVYLDSDASKQIQIHIVVDQSASRQVIEQHLPSLQQALDQQGLNMGGFSMASQHDQRRQSTDAHDGQHTTDHAGQANDKAFGFTETRRSDANARLSIRI